MIEWNNNSHQMRSLSAEYLHTLQTRRALSFLANPRDMQGAQPTLSTLMLTRDSFFVTSSVQINCTLFFEPLHSRPWALLFQHGQCVVCQVPLRYQYEAAGRSNEIPPRYKTLASNLSRAYNMGLSPRPRLLYLPARLKILRRTPEVAPETRPELPGSLGSRTSGVVQQE